MQFSSGQRPRPELTALLPSLSRLLVSCLLLLLDLTLNLLNIMRWTHLSISVWTCLHEVASRIPKSRQIVEQGFIRPLMVTASLTSKIKPEFSKYWVSTCAIWTVLPYSQQCYSLFMLVIFFAYRKCQKSMARALINQFFCPIVSQFHCHLDLKLIQNMTSTWNSKTTCLCDSHLVTGKLAKSLNWIGPYTGWGNHQLYGKRNLVKYFESLAFNWFFMNPTA